MKQLIILAVVSFIAFSCKSKESVNNNANEPQMESRSADQGSKGKRGERPTRGGDRKGPPSIDEVFKMDVNGDNRLSPSEVSESPMARHFTEIDSNNDGFISKEEFQNAPRPQRGQRPQRNN